MHIIFTLLKTSLLAFFESFCFSHWFRCESLGTGRCFDSYRRLTTYTKPLTRKTQLKLLAGLNNADCYTSLKTSRYDLN